MGLVGGGACLRQRGLMIGLGGGVRVRGGTDEMKRTSQDNAEMRGDKRGGLGGVFCLLVCLLCCSALMFHAL